MVFSEKLMRTRKNCLHKSASQINTKFSDFLMFLCWKNRRKLINTLEKQSKERKITQEKHIKEATSSVITIRIHEHRIISMENTIETIWIIYNCCLISCHFPFTCQNINYNFVVSIEFRMNLSLKWKDTE